MHAFSLLRVIATELVARPVMELVVLLQTTHLLPQLGIVTNSAATRTLLARSCCPTIISTIGTFTFVVV